jgi:hypothetical protein
MAAVVSLRAVVDQIEIQPQEWRGFLNIRTGELFSASSDDFSAAEEGEQEEEEVGDDEEFLASDVEDIEKVREILASSDWVELPARESREDYRTMERFCLERCEGRVQDDLLRAIDGRGAFRYFQDTVRRHGIEKAWYAFRDQAVAEEVAGWLEANEIEYGP